MTTSTGTYTNAGYAEIAQLGASQVGVDNADSEKMRLSYFVIGEGGHVGGVPNVPSRLMTDIEAQGYGVDGKFRFQKSFGAGDVSVGGPSSNILTIVCLVDDGEANDRGDGNPPTFYELGVYDENDVMVAYLTFDGQLKVVGEPIQHTVKINYGTP
tara:strand:- start:1435 stop:1902 length:468 start_codon:yes stop_codon:yes gene_type:complete